MKKRKPTPPPEVYEVAAERHEQAGYAAVVGFFEAFKADPLAALLFSKASVSIRREVLRGIQIDKSVALLAERIVIAELKSVKST